MSGRIKTLLCGVGAALLMASMAEDAAARGTGDVARVKGKDGVWTEVPLAGVREADGGVRYTFPAAEARKAQSVQFWLDRAQAKTGEDGFWMGGRGVVGYFTREKMRWVNGAQFMDHPYFAMQTPRGAFIAIVEGMRFEFNVVVEAKDGRYRAYPSWDIERHAFGEVYEDLSLVVYDLGKGADWNAMAKAYRRRVLAREGATRRIETLKERAKARPHLLKMANAIALRRRHACKPYVFKDPKHDVDFTPETEKKPECLYSFAQTLAFLQRLKALGVDDVALCVAGWQDGGYDGRCPSSFPVSPEAGGEAELRKLIRGGHALGYIVDGHSNYTDCYAVSFAGGRAYRLCLKNAWETFLPGELEKIAALGFRGAHYIDVFTAVYPYACCDPRHRANRKEIAACQRQVVERCIALFGGFSSECDMDHLIGLVDYVNYNTREIKNAQVARAKGRNLPFDRIVPFSELAFHDYLLANPDKSTQEFPSGQDWLDLVEFGGRPIVYKFTDEDAERIRDLYLRFKPLRHLQLEEMVEHRDVAPGVVRVTYGDGSRVYVNHTDALAEADGVRVPAMDYVLLDALRPDVHGGAARQSGREHDDLPARLETLGLHGYHPVTGTWVLRVVRTRTFPPCGRGGGVVQ